MDVAAAVVVGLPAMTIPAAGTKGNVTTVVPTMWKAVAPDVPECLKRMSATAGRVVPLHGTKEEREDITIIPAFPVKIPAAVTRNKDYMGKSKGLPAFRWAFVISDF